jgi:ADP-ribosylglycohydrolase
MRVAPIGYAFHSLEETLAQAEASASPTHNHPEGIASARAIAEAIFLLRTQKISQKEVAGHLTDRYGYRIELDLDRARANNRYSETAIACVPVAVTAFANSVSLEDCVRKAVSLGGDSDTIAAIAGGLAEACFGIPEELKRQVSGYLPDEFLSLIQAFYSKK